MTQLRSYTDEIWKDVIGWEGLYQVSSYGRVKSFRKKEPRLLSTCVGTHIFGSDNPRFGIGVEEGDYVISAG